MGAKDNRQVYASSPPVLSQSKIALKRSARRKPCSGGLKGTKNASVMKRGHPRNEQELSDVVVRQGRKKLI